MRRERGVPERRAILAEWRRQRGRTRPRRDRAALRASEALDRLTTRYAAEEPRIKLRAAVTLIANAWHDAGPSAATFDAADYARRLAGELGYVRDVERVVREEAGAPAVFT